MATNTANIPFTSASEMTYIVSSGALNSTHSQQIYQNWTCNMYQLNMNVPGKTCIRYMSSCSLMFCHVFMPYFMQRKH